MHFKLELTFFGPTTHRNCVVIKDKDKLLNQQPWHYHEALFTLLEEHFSLSDAELSGVLVFWRDVRSEHG